MQLDKASRLVWSAGTAALALFAGIAAYLWPLQPGVLALQFANTPAAFGFVIHAWPAEHLLRYRGHLPYDCLLLLTYGAFGYLLATRSALFAGLPAAWRIVAGYLLPLAAVFDATENAFHWWLTAAPRFGIGWAYGVSASCSAIKWLLLLAYALTILHALQKAED